MGGIGRFLLISMNIVLIGFMGAGKTTIAKRIQEKNGWEILEMDDLVVAKSGLRSINEIFEKEGETRFREFEQSVARELSNVDKKIISTGGGVVMNQLNMLYLKRNAKIFYLECDFNVIAKRLSGATDRPLFRDKVKAEKLYNLRVPLYKFYADEVVDSNRSESAVMAILKNY